MWSRSNGSTTHSPSRSIDRGDTNAINAQLRDELWAALSLACVDDSIRHVLLRGNGDSFCSGGDLGEFGQRPDPATAHVTRLARSPARLIHRLKDRITVEVHGATLGGGLEMAAFREQGRRGTRRTVRVAGARVGSDPRCWRNSCSVDQRGSADKRAAKLALTGHVIDAETALSWGLVDEIATT